LVFFRDVGDRRRASPEEPPPEPEYVFTTSQTVDEDQTYRYAEASGDHNPIHIDPEFARNAAGLPGIILHGMATMAFASKAVLDNVAGADPARLRRIKVRFSKPVFPGDTLTTRGWVESTEDGVTTYGFETLNGRGSAVLRNGIAEVVDAP
jgi:acyl dehydratase